MILVTGATGFLGSQLVYDLVSQGNKVRALKRFHSRIPKKLYPFSNLIEWIEADLTDIIALEDAMRSVKYVYHCAAMVSFDPAKKKEMWKINVEGTANIVNLCLDMPIEKLVHVSSIATLGDSKSEILIDENCYWHFSKDKSDYSVSKYEGEQEVWRGITEGLCAVIVNPSVIIGYDEHKTSSSKLFETIAKGMPFYTNGITGFVDVKDVSRIMIELMNSTISSERFILSSENISYKALFDMIADAMGKKRPSIKTPIWLSYLIVFFEKARQLFTGKEPRITRYTAQTAFKNHLLSNKKICTMLDTKFTPIAETIAIACKSYFVS